MAPSIVLFFSGLICVGWLLDLWFKGPPPRLLVWLLSVLSLTYFREPVYETEDEWLIHASLNLGLLGQLLTCPLCLSQHLSFWGAIYLQLFLDSPDVTHRCGLFLVCALGWPFLINLLRETRHGKNQ